MPAAIIASMSLSCGAGHADDVSKRWGDEILDEDSRDRLGGVIYWLCRDSFSQLRVLHADDTALGPLYE